MKKRRLISFVIALVSIAVFCLNVPIKVLAEDMKEDRDIEEYADKTGFSSDTEVAYSPLVSEIETLRGESEKRFLREDGAYEAVVYPYPVHKEGNGTWKDIDNTLTYTEEGFTTKDGADVIFGESLKEDKAISYGKEGKRVSWSFPGLKTAEGRITEKEQYIYSSEEERSDMEKRFPKELSDGIIYEDEGEGISVRYSLTSYILSEYITLNSIPEETLRIEAVLETEGLVLHKQEDGSVEFKDENGETVFIMSPYVMEDKNREESTEINVILEPLTEEKEEIPETEPEQDEEPEEINDFTPVRLDTDHEHEDNDNDLIPDFYEGIDTDEDLTVSIFRFEDPDGNIYYRIYGTSGDITGFFACDEEGTIEHAVSIEDDRMLFLNGEGAAADTQTEQIPETVEEGTPEKADEAREEGNRYILVIEPDMDWLLSEEREYPVVIDPDIRPVFSGTVYDTYISNNDRSENYGLRDRLKLGASSHYRSLIKIDSLPSLEAGDVVIEGTLNLSRYNSNQSNAKVIDLYRVLTSWNETTVTWNSFSPDSSSSVDTSRIYTIGLSAPYNTFNTFDITDLMKMWYSDPSTNKGVLLKMAAEASNWYVEYRSANYNSSYPGHPYFSLIYVNSTGLEDRYTYLSQSAGRAGTGSVNAFSGNLTWTHDDAEIVNCPLPIELSHVYNTNDRNTDIGYGYGWRLNYSQSLKKMELTNRTETLTYYRLIDGDGTRQYYRYSTATEYVNELDKDSKLTISGTTATIEDKGGNKLIFTLDSEGENGRLNTVEDANGNRTLITYSTTTVTDLKITKIQEQLKGESAGQYLTLSYSGGHLSQITVPSGLNVSYSYTSGDLTGITYADSKSVSFTYSSHCLKKANNIDNYSINYTYTGNTPFRVTRAEEKKGTTAGQYISLDYGWNTTTVTDKQGRDTTYQFSNGGQAVSIRDNSGRAVYGAYESGDRMTTKLSAVSKMQGTVINLLKNHGFESSNAWTLSSSTYVTYSTVYFHEGKQSLKMVSAEGRTVTASQAFTAVTGKTYTFSAWITGRSGAVLKVKSGSTVIAESDASAASTTGSAWTRAKVTFKATTASLTFVIELPETSPGTVYIDSVQLEEGESANRYNMLLNSDFTNGSTSWTTNANVVSPDGVVSSGGGTHPASLSDNVFYLKGVADETKYVMQTIPVNGKKGDTYSFGGWVKSDGIPQTRQPLSTTETQLCGLKRLMIQFFDGSAVVNYVFAYFPADTDEWQFTCGSAVAKEDYTAIRISLNYHYNRNSCYFDGIQLYREEFSQAYSYDTNGNLTGYTSLIGQQETFTYDSNNNVTKSKDPKGNETTYTYDTKHNLLSSTSEEGVVTSNTYNVKGQVTETKTGTSSSYIRTGSAYNSAGLVTSVTDGGGNQVSYQYNTNTRKQTSVTAPKGNTSTYTYKPANEMLRLGSVSSSGTGTVSYGYDTYGKLTSATRGSTVYSLTYDTWNRSLATKVGTTALSTNSYDSYGRLDTVTYANGYIEKYIYDELDRVTEVKINGVKRYEYIYDNEGNLYEERNYVALRTKFYEYDHAGKCMAMTEKNFTVSGTDIIYGTLVSSYRYEYDQNNDLVKHKDHTIGYNWQTVYTYDGDRRPVTSTLNTGKVITNTYDEIGRVTRRRIGLTSNYDTVMTYKAGVSGSKTTQLSTYKNGNDTAFSYSYDANGNITSISQGSVSVTYTYDQANQLTRENNGFTNETVTYTYDSWGNILEKDIYPYTTGTLGTPTETISYTYGNSVWKDQLTGCNGQTITYDQNGNPTSYLGKALSWEGKRLTGGSWTNYTVSYSYDENGIRTQKTVNGVTTKYYYNGDLLISEFPGNNSLLFSYDPQGRVLAVRFNTVYYYYVRNGQGDIIKLIDGDGNTVVEYVYDSWGKQISCTGTLASTLGKYNPFRYRGYVYDVESGFYYLKTRYYDPSIGRFISSDVYLSTGQGVIGNNSYAYCLNDPINMQDTSGSIPNVNVNMADSGGCETFSESLQRKIRELYSIHEYSLENWKTKSRREKAHIMEDFFSEVSNILGVRGFKILLVKDKLKGKDFTAAGTTYADERTIYINFRDDPVPYERLKAIVHELRHAYQYMVFFGLIAHGESKKTAQIWEANWNNYVSYEEELYNYNEYLRQPIEFDAKWFADELSN